MTRRARPLALATLIFVSSCGGGGGGQPAGETPGGPVISSTGQAAVGAAMSNATLDFLSLADGATRQAVADGQGMFTVPADLQAPVLVQATSTNSAFMLFGYMRQHGQHVAVNPVSTTLIALAAARHPSAITTPLASEQLGAGQASVSAAFGPVLSATQVPASTDFLSARFSTDHTGLDLVLDSIGVQLIGDGSVVLTNKISGQRQTVRTGSVSPLEFDAASIARVEDLPIGLCADTLEGMSSETLASDTTAYDPAFLDSGRSLSTQMALVATAAGSSMYRLSMPVFAGVDANGNMVFSAMQINVASGRYLADTTVTVAPNTQGRCVIVGNRYPFNVSVQPAIKRLIRLDGLSGLANHEVVPAVNGLEVQVGAPDSGSAVNTTTGAPGGEQIRSVRVDACAPDGSCVNLATLHSQNKPTNKGTFRIDGSAYDFMDMMSAPSIDVLTGAANPIKVTFFNSVTAPSDPADDTGRVGMPLYTKVAGPVFSESELASIVLPTARNPSYLQSFNDRPTAEYDAGTGTLRSIGFLSQALTMPLKSVSVLVMKPGAGSVTAPASADYENASYRSLTLFARIPSRAGFVVTKYLWAPGSPGSY